jgi:hypothetical protein
LLKKRLDSRCLVVQSTAVVVEMPRFQETVLKIAFKWGRHLLLVIMALAIFLHYKLVSSFVGNMHEVSDEFQPREQRCAINFFGLPRAFESLVLPSLVRNVLKPNAAYNCDYFVHFYYLKEEAAGRSGHGGAINPEAVYLLKDEVLKLQKGGRIPTVKFTVTQEADFWKQYQPLLDKIHDTKDENGKYLYFPWKARTYKHPVTVDNIIKMWHSIQESWNLMQQNALDKHVEYTQVAMLRADVLYMSPIDIYEYSDSHQVVVPGFGRHPVSDRIVFGPASAVRVWATQRFPRLEQHVQFVQKNDAGWGLHSERFLNYTIFPGMRNALASAKHTGKDVIVEHPTICFFRVRADETVWVSDCDGTEQVAKPSIRKHMLEGHDGLKDAVEKVLGRACHGPVTKLTTIVRTVNCTKN